MSTVLHIISGTDDVANGMVVVAQLLAKEQGDAEVVDLTNAYRGKIAAADEVWVHGMWLPKEWAVCRAVLRAGKRLVRMTHGSLSPIYLTQQSPLKKKLISPIERYFLRRADKVVATCEADKGWIESYLGRHCPPIELTDIKRFFKLGNGERGMGNGKKDALHILYLGRKHPLKGVEYLETAVAQLTRSHPSSDRLRGSLRSGDTFPVPHSPQLKVVSNAFGEELEKVWDWCDVLVLPTLSENFGLVIAEALERGKCVITTDGAPAWGENLSRVERVDGGMWSGYGGRLIYLKGYREGTKEQCVELLRRAIELMSAGEMMAVS